PLDPWDSCRQQVKISNNDKDGDADLDESSRQGQFEIDTASTFADNSSEMTETFDKAVGSPDHAVQFELSNYSDNSGTDSDA
ncbi:Hypothetical predicted protein, partial [Paramuricea clavata]